MILRLTCTFGRSFATGQIVVTHDGGRPTTTTLPIASTSVNGLTNVTATYSSAAVQNTVQFVTSRAINNLAFVYIGLDIANKKPPALQSCSISNVKICADQMIVIGNGVCVVQMLLGKMHLRSL